MVYRYGMIDPVHADFVETFLPFARQSRNVLAIWTRMLLGLRAPIEALGEKLSPEDELERERCERATQAIERQDGVDLILARPFDLMPPPRGLTDQPTLRVLNRYFEKGTAKPTKLVVDCRKGWVKKTCNVAMLRICLARKVPDLSVFEVPYEFNSDIRHDIPMTEMLSVWRQP